MAPVAAEEITQEKEQAMTYLVVLLAVLTRFIPHLPDFSPVMATLLFGGAHLKRRDAIWYPLVLLAIATVVQTTLVYRMPLNWSQGIVWLGFAAVALIGYWLRRHETFTTIGIAALAAPTIFLLISNFGVWLGWRLYPVTWAGLITCYTAALPFYRNALVASVAYTAILFGADEIYRRRHSELAATAQAN